nr:hypothetical protein [Pedobacter panaciterrae]
MKNKNSIIFSLFLVITISISLFGCGKKDPKPENGNKISMKMTVTVTGADQNDQVDFQVSAGNHDASQYGAPVWKMNGTSQGNQHSIIVDEQSFIGTTKTYVFETVKPFDFGELNFSISNFDGGPITTSYKTEVNGNIETNVENLVLSAGQSYNKKFTYTAK